MKTKIPITTKNTLITAGAIIFAAIIGLKSCQKELPKINSTNNQGNTYIFQNIGTVELPEKLPRSTTGKTIEEFETKLKQAEEKIELSKKDIEALTNALKDLDQRTSGIKQLPDGRTQIGYMISGEPIIVLKHYSSAVSFYKGRDFENAFIHSQKAINALEETNKIERTMEVGQLTPEFIATLYRLGGVTAQELSKNDIASAYAKKALEIVNSPINKAFLSTTLANLNKYEEALKYIEEASEKEPQNEYYKKLKQLYMQEISKK